jgi:modified peptide precursor CbpA
VEFQAKGSGGMFLSRQAAGALLLFFIPSREDPMKATTQVTSQATTAQQAATQPTQAAAPAPVIASRKSCNPDGIGLSHYVLMDRKAAK